MIIQKGFNTGDVLTFKLMSGEEMIARYQGETITEFQITKPAIMMPTDRGTFGMLPPVFSGELNTNTINLQKSAVVMLMPTKKDVADQYTQATSNIKPASDLTGIMK